MGKDSVLVTGVGGGVGQSVIKALANTNYRVVAIDSEFLAAGLYASDKAYIGLYASDAQYINRIMDVCEKEQCGIIFAGHDVELLPLAENMDLFKANGITPVVSTADIIRVCDDKLKTTHYLQSCGFPVPVTSRLLDVDRFNGPVVLKPQCGGARSRNTYIARTASEFDRYRQLVDVNNCVVQEYIEGDEYTCGSVSLGGRCMGVILMRRILRDGDTYKAFVERNSNLEYVIESIVQQLKPFGACNIQMRVRDGVPYVFEINARCSGTTGARAIAGFNEPLAIADYVYHGVLPAFAIREISILRYWKELEVSNERIHAMRTDRVLQGDGTVL